MFKYIRQLVQKLKKDTKVETQHPLSHSNGNTLVVRSPKLSKLTNDEIMAKSKFYSKSAK